MTDNQQPQPHWPVTLELSEKLDRLTPAQAMTLEQLMTVQQQIDTLVATRERLIVHAKEVDGITYGMIEAKTGIPKPQVWRAYKRWLENPPGRRVRVTRK